MNVYSSAARLALAPTSYNAFNDINNQVILGASNHIKMIGEMIENIVIDSNQKNEDVATMLHRIDTVTTFFNATRGQASQAITNAIAIMTLNMKSYDGDAVDVGKKIIEQKNAYQRISKQSVDKIIEYGKEALKDKKKVFVYDYSSTVERILETLEENTEVYIAESRIIDGGKPFVKCCQAKKHKITFLPDASIMYFLKQCDVALMGAETFYPDGTGFNTTGSDIVGLVCHTYNIPLYFLTPLIKVDNRPLYGGKKTIVYNDVKHKLGQALENTDGINFVTPELIGVPANHIHAYITEKGVIPAVSMFTISMEYLKEIRG